jgi:hypothetical protein
MSAGTPRSTPEQRHLASQQELLAELGGTLASREAEFAALGTEFARFRRHYLQRFAPLYAERDALEAKIADLISRAEPSATNEKRKREAAQRAAETRRLAEGQEPGQGETDRPQREVPADLRAAYREAARLMHPDLTPIESERKRRTVLMAQLNEAYEAGDQSAIERIVLAESSRPEAIVGDDVGSQLVRVLRQIDAVRARIREIDSLKESLGIDPLFRLYAECRQEWLDGSDSLAGDEEALRGEIASLRAQLEAFRLQRMETSKG